MEKQTGEFEPVNQEKSPPIAVSEDEIRDLIDRCHAFALACQVPPDQYLRVFDC